MNYLSPYEHVDEELSQSLSQRSSSHASSRMTSRSASPCRRNRSRANSLTPPQDESEQLSSSPLPLRKRPPRPTQLNEIFRPRCNTDPSRSRSQGNTNSSSSKKTSTSRSVLGSLLRQTLKVTTASVGLSASDERLTQLATTGSLGDNAKRKHSRSTSSVVNTVANGGNGGTDERATTSMAPLQLATTTAANKDTSGSETGTTLSIHQQRLQQQQLEQLQQRREQYIQQLSLPETFDPEHSSLPQSYATSGAPLEPSGSVHSLGSSSSHSQSHSPRSSQSQGKGSSGSTAGNKGGKTAKQHDQQTSAVAAISSTSAAAGVAATAQVAGATPPEKEKDKEKEKKRKEVSSSRVKKFHRHFSQVSKDEKLINYFSCALVGDIPLQGHLYITEDHFAFYSNVFGYVTKVVIPTTSVTKISKEKTAKIIPNAVGVATADERHVFGSFISREAAFRLMCTVCTQLATGNEILPKPLPVDVELTEEYLIDDDSSCSISGNESPPHLRSAAAAAAAAAGGASEPETMLRQRNLSDRHFDLQGNSTLAVDNGISLVGQMIVRSSAPPVVQYVAETQALLGGGGGSGSRQSTSLSTSASSSGPTSSSSSPITVVGMGVNVGVSTTTTTTTRNTIGGRLSSMRSRLRQQLPTLTELHVLYLGIMLAIMLALFSVFLLYRIVDIEAKTHLYNTPVDFNLRSGNDEDLFAEALRWQKELQDKSTAEAQHILSKNLEQISKVRRSLETLSMLIHDRRAGYGQPEMEMETQMDMDMEMEGAGGLESELLPSVHVASSSSDFSD